MKQGRFIEEEDEIIRKRITEWGDRGRGLWVSLEKEIGRPAKSISQRYRNILTKNKKQKK